MLMREIIEAIENRGLSLWQPWASLWLSAYKSYETRSWNTKYRGRLYVHAGKHMVKDISEELDNIVIKAFGKDWRETLPTGALIGWVELKDIYPVEDIRNHISKVELACGDYSDHRYAWYRTDYKNIMPIDYKASQKIFKIPDNFGLSDKISVKKGMINET